MRSRAQCLVTIALLFLSTGALAATWRVELDGTGDFTTIQDAVDAAAEGDSILVGAGEFVDSRPIETWDGFRSTAAVTKSGLVIRGAGAEQTIVGEDVVDWYYMPIFAPSEPNAIDSLTICDLTIRAGWNGIHYESNGLTVERCWFLRSTNGILGIDVHTAEISECEFSYNYTGIFLTTGSENWTIENSSFDNCDHGISFQASVNIQVRDCLVENSTVGIQYDISSGSISGTRVNGSSEIVNGVGVECVSGSHVTMTDCVIDYSMAPTFAALAVDGGEFSASGNQIRCGGNATVYFNGTADRHLDFHNNEMYKASQFTLVFKEYNGNANDPLNHYDLSNNYWGTTNADSISAWIDDAKDHPNNAPYWAVVDFEPFIEAPVATESKSFSDLKGLFR